MKLNKNHALLFLFVGGFGKTLVVSPTFVDAALLLVLGLVFAYNEYQVSNKQVKSLEEKLEAQNKEIEILKEKVSTIKIIQQARPSAVSIKQS